MAITKVKKVQIAAVSEHREKLLNELQNLGSFQLLEIDADTGLSKESKEDLQKIQKVELDFANVEYAIRLLAPHGKKRGLLEGPITLTTQEIEDKAQKFNLDETVKKCNETEDKLSKAKNELAFLQNEQTIYQPWKNLDISLENIKGAATAGVVLGTIKTAAMDAMVKELESVDRLLSVETVNKDEKDTYLAVIFDRNLEAQIKEILSEHKFTETEMPAGTGLLKDYLDKVDQKITENKKTIDEQEKELTRLAKHLDDLKIVHDYLAWQKEIGESKRIMGNTDYSFIIKGWIPAQKLKDLEDAFAKNTKEFDITELKLEEGELPPVIIENNRIIKPFETLTTMFGLPKYGAIDPTPFLSIFFIVFFALCLTDAAYGIVMFIIMFLAQKYMKMGEGVKKLVRLLMYGGLVTGVIGALFGGWFGFLAEDMPDWLTYTSASGEKMFLFQAVNSVSNPIAVLVLSLALGFIQILLGVYMKLVHDFRHNGKLDAVLDTGTWAFMLTGIGVYIVAAAGLLPGIMATVGQWWVIAGAVFLILTQGRDKKNIVSKLISGVLSLYGLVNYMSDVLSYSRLLALGLATTIIALAVNVIVELLFGIPYVGWIFAIGVFVGGHLFNLVINSLGSFIHSGRLQFVEFFGKFMEAGGKEFKPFSRKSKYVFLKNN